MRKFTIAGLLASAFLGNAILTASIAGAQETATEEAKKEGVQLKLAGGDMQMVAPESWKQVKARSSMLSYEFSAPADAKKDDPTARITVMRAGGSIKANIDRWIGQFAQPDGKAT
ncbi:MAG: hypothetical protein AAGG44_13680 [Planctomycetota bacterium]